MADQETVNMVMRDVMGYDIPDGKAKTTVEEQAEEVAQIEITDKKLHRLIEGSEVPGVSSQCVLNYLASQDGAIRTPVPVAESAPASTPSSAPADMDATTQMITDMLGQLG